jgi:hypothetical protein
MLAHFANQPFSLSTAEARSQEHLPIPTVEHAEMVLKEFEEK